MWDASLGKSWMPVEHYADFVGGVHAELRTWRATRAPALMLKRAPPPPLPKPAADDAPKTAALPVAFSVNEDKQRDYQTAECTWPDSTAFPSVLQKAAGFAVAGKPWGGVLLTDRGQYPALHGVENDACEADSSACAETFDVACRLSGDYDATLDCVEDCVEKPFRSFSSPDWTGPAATACDDPVLSAFELTPSIIKSCLDPTYDRRRAASTPWTRRWAATTCSGCIDLAEGTKRELKLESDCGLDEDGASIFA
ncbi:hypothetical protein JL721_4295 [Aureococcus anophagefferens]|nr:hypothetical protein JL721_4295 [Aureococcus anophagefferens]